jgi:hypothetical protein
MSYLFCFLFPVALLVAVQQAVDVRQPSLGSTDAHGRRRLRSCKVGHMGGRGLRCAQIEFSTPPALHLPIIFYLCTSPSWILPPGEIMTKRQIALSLSKPQSAGAACCWVTATAAAAIHAAHAATATHAASAATTASAATAAPSPPPPPPPPMPPPPAPRRHRHGRRWWRRRRHGWRWRHGQQVGRETGNINAWKAWKAKRPRRRTTRPGSGADAWPRTIARAGPLRRLRFAGQGAEGGCPN